MTDKAPWVVKRSKSQPGTFYVKGPGDRRTNPGMTPEEAELEANRLNRQWAERWCPDD